MEDAKLATTGTSPRLRGVKALILQLLKENNTPHEIALGTAIGVFIGITPLYGFHLLMGVIAALLFSNIKKIAIFLGMNISVPPTIPFITWASYTIGRLFVGKDYPALSWDSFRSISFNTIFQFFYPLLVGSLILGTGLAAFFYFVTLWFITKRREQQKQLRKL
ncbi:MAG TPA: DUF2062 domain-containing protein [Candidatus Omnitrophota bacterium]|nr:DUF2062 domain-containing protein [Candidatus Omnitrophota bacterium]